MIRACACILAVLVSSVNFIGAQEQTPANNQVCLIVPPDVEECYLKFQGKPIDNKAAQVNCLQKLLWNFRPETNLTEAELAYFRTLVKDAPPSAGAEDLASRIGLPPSGSRTRKEYRLLSGEEKMRFHAALNKLYEDGTIFTFARLYAEASQNHLNGASYLPWNRVFLALFEEALRRHDNTVFLPFWDSTIDNAMDNPLNSALWMKDYFGGGTGDVIDGPAAGWVTSQGNLERNYGRQSRLLSKDDIRNILTRCNLREISQPFASRRYDFEYYFGGPLQWVGGDMQAPATSGYDPVFYMHLAFADYVWELFRRRQFSRCGVDPAMDYPDLPRDDTHKADAPMTGFDWLTNRDGIKHDWMDNWYDYESTPSCPNCCNGCNFPPPVYCDIRRRVCVARSRRTFSFGPRNAKHSNIRELFSQARLDLREIESLEIQAPPRNRGTIFHAAPPGDGRTIYTAIADAFEFARQHGISSPREQTRPSPSDTLGSAADGRGPQPQPDRRGERTDPRGGPLPDLPAKVPLDRRPQPLVDPRGSSLGGSRRSPMPDVRRPSIDPRGSFNDRRRQIVSRTPHMMQRGGPRIVMTEHIGGHRGAPIHGHTVRPTIGPRNRISGPRLGFSPRRGFVDGVRT